MFKNILENLKNKKKWILFIFVSLIILIILNYFCYIIISSIIYLFTNNFTLNFSVIYKIKISFSFYMSLVISLAFELYSFICFFLKTSKNKNKHVIKTDSSEYGCGKWIIDERKPNNVDLKEFEKYYCKDFKTPSYLTRISIMGKKLVYHGISVIKVVHQIIIGSTGSGKTQKIILPTIWLNSRLKDKKLDNGEYENNKPSFVITDPKGEIFATTKMDLEKQGYDVKVLNFKDPSQSMGWNPLTQALKYFEIAITYEKENIHKVKIKNSSSEETKNYIKNNSCLNHTKKNCLVCLENFNKSKNKWFWIDKFEKYIIYDADIFKKHLISQIKKFKSLSNQEITDLTEILIKSNDVKEITWPNGAKNLIKGVLLAMLEIKEKDFNAVNEKNFNMVTVQKILANRASLNEWFKKYGKEFPTSSAWTTCSSQIDCSEATNSSFFSAVSNGTRIFADDSLQDVLCKNDIDLFNICSKEKPTALFLIIPDQRKDKHPLASLFVSQLYLACSFVADKNRIERGKEELDRDLLFLLEEFGNMPAIPNFDNILSVSRSRRIFFTLIVQDLDQINKEYSNSSTTIKSNCLLTVYLKSDNEEINEMIAKKCGKETILTQSISKNKEVLEKAATSMTGKDLISASDLFKLTSNDDELAVILLVGDQPSISRLKHYYKLKKENLMNFKSGLSYSSIPDPIIYDETYFFNLANYVFKKQKNTITKQNVEFSDSFKTELKYNDKLDKVDKQIYNGLKLKFENENEVNKILSISKLKSTINKLEKELNILRKADEPDAKKINEIKKEIKKYKVLEEEQIAKGIVGWYDELGGNLWQKKI
ncbi:type IV secretory system conjugative DNA transfer family protein [Mesoplasma melaleucae]|uniref:Conjugation protein n=1 Tax=Mesoplasma melaleucae TaxID=81459 RepID=A0A2K8NVL9_9MOLU|nr:type IV secretory system conjugative DNA transfer family protein [Mesoplasma melaleucae]ATZ17817.1 conjugation protein [Mesoplasma melaleucae]